MDIQLDFLTKLKTYGVGRRKLDDDLFVNEKPPRLGIYDAEEDHCHAVHSTLTQCTVPCCDFVAESVLQFENHYNALHRYSCSQCKKVLPSPHLLDLHIQEQHDSFFAVMAAKKPSYCCYIEECKDKFMNADERLNHCVKIHKFPRDFRFCPKPRKQKERKSKMTQTNSMETDKIKDNTMQKDRAFSFTNSKQKVFSYTGKKFTKEQDKSVDVDMDAIMLDLKENLPQT